MTAEIITFPTAKRPPAKKPYSRKEYLDQIFNAALIIQRQGLRPEDLPADTDPIVRGLTEILMKPPSKHDPDGNNTA